MKNLTPQVRRSPRLGQQTKNLTEYQTRNHRRSGACGRVTTDWHKTHTAWSPAGLSDGEPGQGTSCVVGCVLMPRPTTNDNKEKHRLTRWALSYMAGFQVISYGRFWVIPEV